ncbi:MAG: glycoside hydrolase family 5 protein [Oligoflexus sp.]
MKRLILGVLLSAIYGCGEVSRNNQHPDKATLSADPVGSLTDQVDAGASFVARHGLLSVANGKIVDASQQPIQLRGMSLFWSQWSSSFWSSNAVGNVAVDWNATVIRAAMGIELGGYLANPAREKEKVKTIVNAAISHGIYVIIDWHDHNATKHTQESVAFFSEMAALYGNNPHVIFEIFNEPLDISWREVKSYAETVIRAIRAQGARNLVIVGTPRWSQRVDLAANDPLSDDNVAYALHFYAGTHRQELRNVASYAMSRGIALFVTEFGVCEASGNGNIDFNESNRWFTFMDQHQISWVNWSLHDKEESASALRPGVNPYGPWSDGDLTKSGLFVRSKMRFTTKNGH